MQWAWGDAMPRHLWGMQAVALGVQAVALGVPSALAVSVFAGVRSAGSW